MNRFIYILIVAIAFGACKDDYYIDTGVSNGSVNITMWEYFKTDSYNWDSTRLVISRAGLEGAFNGEAAIGNKITFLGVTNHSIRKFMLDNNYASVNDIPQDICKEYILDYIISDELLWDNIEFEVKGTTSGEGGTLINNENGGELRLFRRKSDYGAVVDAGPVSTFVQSSTVNKTIQLVSTNIQTTTGVVHSLSYTHVFGPF